ncbi:FtsX-like permease family protein [Mucilaginibacter sabulilitoris]|uniref:FtsX-like permease family protein n=1 Tax=Mucilaginibacter sabulilitoris TaxID=1173583 RepID=A0ABZ0TQ27_9SPHI|nr:FtsX-like permease family protein [Mucilaginibacter sabulilitoris]WPU94567.1 FtsX-like permease family protein [Mucilaginibacter sabulilitoris]
MNTSVYIAKRYLFSGKKMHAINIISGISMLGVLIGSAALIIILSVFNGFEKVILSLYSNFTPEIKIETRRGKTFDPNIPYFNALHRDARIISYTQVLEEKVLIRYGDKPFLGTIKGVSDDFLKNKQLDSTVSNGSFTLKSNKQMFAVVGSTIQGNLGINVHDNLTPLQIYSPRRGIISSANPLDEFVVRSINVSGVFAIQQEFDDILVTPIEFARDLLDQPKEVSSIELTYKRGTDLTSVQKDIEQAVGSKYTVKNRKEQNTELYKTLNYERWSIFMILTFVLIIAIFNIIGSLTMLVIDKRQDIAILSSLGANKQTIQGIFFFEGMMISLIGCVAGVLLGLVFCLLQQHYGWIKMGAQMSVIDAYPIDLDIANFGLVFLTVGAISVVASGISARLSIKGLDEIKQDL